MQVNEKQGNAKSVLPCFVLLFLQPLQQMSVQTLINKALLLHFHLRRMEKFCENPRLFGGGEPLQRLCTQDGDLFILGLPLPYFECDVLLVFPFQFRAFFLQATAFFCKLFYSILRFAQLLDGMGCKKVAAPRQAVLVEGDLHRAAFIDG